MIVDLGLQLHLVLQVLGQSVFNHVGVIGREEVGLLVEHVHVVLQLLLGLVQGLVGGVKFGLFASHVGAPHHLFLSGLHTLQLLGFFLLALLLDALLDSLVSALELLEDLSRGRHGSLHPGVVEHLLGRRAVRGVKLQHALHEVLEVLREESLSAGLVLAVSSPEDVGSVGGEAAVEGVLGLSSRERRMLGHHDEQNDGSGKQVD
mmetsp:Transcript_10010/g.15178  ORF Transcript_10010/g.15178 Transcript_10010/m.15178 type:complete len:205 (+) Transcript_10010:322-936(+)